MKFVPHLVRKDLRAVAGIALLWTLLMALEVALQVTGAAAWLRQNEQEDTALALLHALLPFVELAVAALAVSLVVHEDSLVDTRAFSLTRPIPRGQLLVSKLIAVAIIIFVPALVALGVVMASHHVPPVHMMRAGVEIVLWLALPLLLMAAAAAFTPTLPRYAAMLAGIVIIGFLFLVVLIGTLWPTPASSFREQVPRYVDPARGVIVTVLLIAGVCATLHQFYRRRDVRVALGCIAVLVAAAALVTRFWPGFTFFEPIGEATGAWTSRERTRLRILDDRTMRVRVFPTSPKEPRLMPAKGDYQPSMTQTFGHSSEMGTTLWSESWPVLLEVGMGLGAALPSPGTSDAAGGGAAFYTGVYEGTFYYRIWRHETVAALRVDRPGTHADGPRSVRIIDNRDLGGECRVTLEVAKTELTMADPREPSLSYYFADRHTGARHRAGRLSRWYGTPGPLRGGLSPSRLRIFVVTYEQWSVDNPRDDGGEDEPRQTCADTNLIVSRTTATGSLTRSITLPDFRVQPQPSQDTSLPLPPKRS